MKKLVALVMALMLIFTLSACGSKKNQKDTGSSPVKNGTTVDTKTSLNQGSIENEKQVEAPNTEVIMPSDEGRKIIYNANSVIEVRDLKEAYDLINKRIKEINGYVANSNVTQYNSEIVARIPSLYLDEFLDYLKTIGDVKSLNRSTEDITEQYTDTVSRIKNLKAQEEQLLVIMKKANTIEEVLKVQSELSRVRGEIEVLEGRVKMWDKLVDLSTVTISLNKAQVIGDKDTKVKFISWEQITKAMANGFKGTLNFVISFISGIFIFIVSAVPVMPFIAFGVWLIIRYRKKIKKDITR